MPVLTKVYFRPPVEFLPGIREKNVVYFSTSCDVTNF